MKILFYGADNSPDVELGQAENRGESRDKRIRQIWIARHANGKATPIFDEVDNPGKVFG